jgi:hypothetical protein
VHIISFGLGTKFSLIAVPLSVQLSLFIIYYLSTKLGWKAAPLPA